MIQRRASVVVAAVLAATVGLLGSGATQTMAGGTSWESRPTGTSLQSAGTSWELNSGTSWE